MSNFAYEQLTIGQLLEFKRGLQLAQTRRVEISYLETVFNALQNGDNIEGAIQTGMEECDL
jgi:hypothetical protein